MEPHPVEVEMGLTAREILDVIQRSDRCYQTVRGFVAEYHLERILIGLQESGHIDSFVRINQDGEPDFRVATGGRTLTVECKNVMSKQRFASGEAKVDFQRTRDPKGKGGGTGRFYKPGEFDVLAAAEHDKGGVWKFKYVRTSDLPQKTEGGTKVITKSVRVPKDVTGTRWTNSLLAALTGYSGPTAEPKPKIQFP